MTVVSDVLVVLGIALFAVAVLGLLRLPDVFTRAHAVAKAETLGLALVVIGLAVRPGTGIDVLVRLVGLLGFAFVGNPTAVHAITRAARRADVRPWRAGDPRPYDPGEGDRERSEPNA